MSNISRYAAIAHDLVFKPAEQAWEPYPYTSGSGETGDLHYFDKPGEWNFHKGEIPRTYVKLNVRDKLKELYPEEYPNLDSVGRAVETVLKDFGVNKYITLEDRGWEQSDYWANQEAIFIPKEDYDRIVTKVEESLTYQMKNFHLMRHLL